MATLEIEAVNPSDEKETTNGNCFAGNKNIDNNKLDFF